MAKLLFSQGPLDGEAWEMPLDEPPERVFDDSDEAETFVYHFIDFSPQFNAWLYELYTSYHYEVPI